MLVTFSANGSGATTLTTFHNDKNDVVYTTSQPHPRKLQLPLMRRSNIGSQETSPFTLLSAGGVSKEKERYLNVQTSGISPCLPLVVDHRCKPSSRKNKMRSAHGDLSGLVTQPRHQQLKQSFAATNHDSFLNQSLIQYSSAPPTHLSDNSSAGCIDPRVLSKSYVPEIHDLAVYELPRQPNPPCESLISPVID